MAEDNSTTEIWKRIDAYPGYEVSSLGRVRSKYRVLKQCLFGSSELPKRYLGVTLRRNRASHSKRVNRLVAEAFNGPCPAGRECAHSDGNSLNNHFKNLEWLTHKQNTAQKLLHGTQCYGESVGAHKITQAQAETIITRSADGDRPKQSAQSLGIHISTASRVSLGSGWGWLHKSMGLSPRDPLLSKIKRIKPAVGQTWKRRGGISFTIDHLTASHAYYWLDRGSSPQFRGIRFDVLWARYRIVQTEPAKKEKANG